MAKKDSIIPLYKVLEIATSATREQIKKAYKKLANNYHPDKETGDAEKFIEVQNAYDAIMDFIKKYPETHAEMVSSSDENEPQSEGEMNVKAHLEIFISTFADQASRTAKGHWESVLDKNLKRKKSIYADYINRLELAESQVEIDRINERYATQTGRLGAETAAGVKRAKRAFVVMILNYINVRSPEEKHEKLSGLSEEFISASKALSLDIESIFDFDITPTLANHFSEEIICRGLDKKYLNSAFGVKGRTAADKTKTTLKDMSDFIDVTQQVYAQLYAEMTLYRFMLEKEYESFKESLY